MRPSTTSQNRVGLIRSETAKKVSQTLAEASATRPKIVGDALNGIAAKDPEILEAVLQVLETEQLLESGASVELLPDGVCGGASAWALLAVAVQRPVDDRAHRTLVEVPAQKRVDRSRRRGRVLDGLLVEDLHKLKSKQEEMDETNLMIT